MTRTSNRLSHPFVLLVGLSAASIAWAQAPEFVGGKAAPVPTVLRIKPDCGQHPWDVTCVCTNPEEQFIAPATCKYLGLEPPKPSWLARWFATTASRD
jgi:hypothetical protein